VSLNLSLSLALSWPQARPYADAFCEEQSSPIYSDSYTSSPPERYRSEFQFALGAPVASPYKSSELPMVYLNKGQFYPITLQGIDNTAGLTASKVKVSLDFFLAQVFRCSKLSSVCRLMV